MPIFSFIGYTLTELFRKNNTWRQIYKQTSSILYTSDDVSLFISLKICWRSHVCKMQKQRNEEVAAGEVAAVGEHYDGVIF